MCLIDTSTLLRIMQPGHPQQEIATRALELLAERGRKLHIVPQNLGEIWAVATRPILQNGLGLSALAALSELALLKRLFVLLPETPAIYPAWEALVFRHHVIGKPTHDARLVAAMQVHGLASIVTFDQSGFSRYPGINVINPGELMSLNKTTPQTPPD